MYPYMVALISEANLGTGAAYCSGILIGNSWVLTVASCLTDGSAGGYYLPGRVLMQLRTTVPPADGDAQYASVPLTTSVRLLTAGLGRRRGGAGGWRAGGWAGRGVGPHPLARVRCEECSQGAAVRWVAMA